MGSLLSYSLYSSILLTLLYLSYKWALSGENQHRYNRTVLWLIYGVSLLALPLSGLSALQMSAPETAMIPDIGLGEPVFALADEPTAAVSQPLWLTLLLAVYLAGVVFTAGQTLFMALKLRRIISGGDMIERGRYRVVLIDDGLVAPFSWCRYVVMSRRDWEENGDMILTHELQHLGLRHWIDLLVAQLVGIFQWYNPAAWLMREEFKTVHEYQADRAVIASGVAVRDYQMLLIKKAVGARFPSLANSLNHSKLKKRITMMYNQNSSASRRLRGLALLPAFAVALAVTNVEAVASVLDDVSSAEISMPQIEAAVPAASPQTFDSPIAMPQESEAIAETAVPDAVTDSKDSENAVISQDESPRTPADAAVRTADEPEKESVSADNLPDNAVFTVVEKKPEFPGGDAEMMKFIAQNVRYPQNAHDKNIQGRVVVQFVIKKDGTIGETKVIRSVDPELDAEAERVVRSLPAFTPGMMNGKPVAVWYTIPIVFKLSAKNGSDEGISSRPAGKVIELSGKNVNADVYVDGKLFEGSLEELDPKTIQEIRVEKGDAEKKDAIYITLKK